VDHVLGLKCTICGAEYGVDEVEYVCPHHGDDGILDVIYDYDLIAQRISPNHLAHDPTHSIWRYLPLLPVNPEVVQTFIGHWSLAHCSLNPLFSVTASFKDRASAIAVVKTRELGYDVVTTASTGNAAAALSGLCAAVAQPNVIFVPKTAPQAKVAQLLAYGSTVMLVDGTYDQAFDLCLEAARAFGWYNRNTGYNPARAFGWYNRNTGYNPYMSEGKKTVAYEICEQLGCRELGIGKLGSWEAPDVVMVPVGDGCIIGGVYKGFKDLLALGWIDHMPRLIGVQATGSSPLVDAWERDLEGWEMEPVQAHSIADSIVAGLPRDRIKALRAVRESGGAFIRVTDEEILAAIPALAQGCGVFAEPAAAAAYAGLVKAVEQGLVAPDDRVVVLSTGSGLKDVSSAMKSVGRPLVVSPDLADVQRVMKD
jgi:threonine synthase